MYHQPMNSASQFGGNRSAVMSLIQGVTKSERLIAMKKNTRCEAPAHKIL